MKQLFPATELQHSVQSMNLFIPSIETGNLRPLEQQKFRLSGKMQARTLVTQCSNKSHLKLQQ